MVGSPCTHARQGLASVDIREHSGTTDLPLRDLTRIVRLGRPVADWFRLIKSMDYSVVVAVWNWLSTVNATQACQDQVACASVPTDDSCAALFGSID